ncbi:hypothetical protein AURDEDRAFT_188497 [Auricularia subglabra TFB-10046 SS5]|nr:hypothetical protein AURDEDRAFT_188497 [Auricularia subglabra TFB-10046 SS5]
MAVPERVTDALIVLAKVAIIVICWPLLLLSFLVVTLWFIIYDCLVPLQNHLSNRKRRWIHLTNVRNPAARLPPEIQLRIFHILATRGQFGRDDRGHRGPLGAPSPASLRACTLVCRAWHGCATEVLYTDASLCAAKRCVLFARTLAARPELARAVRRLELPTEMRYLPDLTREHSLQPVYKRKYFPLRTSGPLMWKDFKAAVDRLLVQCVNVDDVVLHTAGDLRRTTGLAQCLSKSRRVPIRRLALGSPEAPERLHVPDVPWTLTTLEFPVSDNTDPFAHMEFLSFYRHQLYASELSFQRFPVLHTLELVWCEFEVLYLAALLAHLPNLRALRWREIFLIDLNNGWQFARPLADVLRSPVQDLITDVSVRQAAGLVAGDLSGFLALTTLTLNAGLLFTLTRVPPQLHTLIVVEIRGADPQDLERAYSESMLWWAATQLKTSITPWREQAPDLRLVQLWDQTDRQGMQVWKIVSFLLEAYLASRGVALDVNLTLDTDTQEHYRERFRDQEMVRRYLWRDVL